MGMLAPFMLRACRPVALNTTLGGGLFSWARSRKFKRESTCTRLHHVRCQSSCHMQLCMHRCNTDLLSEQAPLENAVEERVLVGVQHCLLRTQQPDVHSSRTTLADDERNCKPIRRCRRCTACWAQDRDCLCPPRSARFQCRSLCPLACAGPASLDEPPCLQSRQITMSCERENNDRDARTPDAPGA